MPLPYRLQDSLTCDKHRLSCLGEVSFNGSDPGCHHPPLQTEGIPFNGKREATGSSGPPSLAEPLVDGLDGISPRLECHRAPQCPANAHA